MKRNYVSNKDESTRMFKSNFMEFFSKVHPAVPVIIFFPVILYLLDYSLFSIFMSVYHVISLLVLGLFIWTITEYLLHRFVFHFPPRGKITSRIHFIFHGVHHDYPRDSRRLVMPPAVSIPLALSFYICFQFILGRIYSIPFFAGFLSGYLFYDITHYAIHHFNIQNGFFLFLKKHHMLHHYMDSTKGFGVSLPIWDIIYKTDFALTNKALRKRTSSSDF